MAVDKALLDFLLSYASENRQALLEKTLRLRTRHLTVAMENTYHSQNASAVLRTCEIFGLQDVHVITERYGQFNTHKKIDMGSLKWLHLHEHESTPSCFHSLKEKGYQIVATSPKAKWTIDDLPIDQKTALVFGAELEGLKPSSIDMADELITIPMYGFTESLNLSVSVALCVRSFIERLHRSETNWQLTENEHDELLLEWVTKSIRNPDALIKHFHQNNPSQ